MADRLTPEHAGGEPLEGLLFCGNPHESVPRALFIDNRLTPLERNAWQVIRMQVARDGMTAFPTYDSLRTYLTYTPCGGHASDETIARALTLLRLTRWLSLVRHRRRATDGRILGNLYVLHDEPLAPNEAIQIDPRYLSLVSDALTHASKAIRCVGFHTLKELAEDPLLSGRSLPSRLQLLTQRMASQGWKPDPEDAIEPHDENASSTSSAMREAQQAPYSARTAVPSEPASESEASVGSYLRNPKEGSSVRTVRTGSIYKEDVRTVPSARGASDASEPTARWLDRLAPEQRSGALAALQRLTPSIRQAVLAEWAARCDGSTVRHPSRYLFGLIQRAMRGQFNPGAYAATQDPSSPVEPRKLSPNLQDPDAVHHHIETLRHLLRL